MKISDRKIDWMDGMKFSAIDSNGEEWQYSHKPSFDKRIALDDCIIGGWLLVVDW